jgi:hypothetical protein
MMNKNIVGLSLGLSLLWSLFASDVGHAVQTASRHDTDKVMVAEMNGTTNELTTQLSRTPNPCNLRGKGRTKAPCGNQTPPESGKVTTDWSPYTNAIFTVMLSVILSALIVLAALSLALIALASLSRRIPHHPLERASINLALCGQGRQAS